MNPETEHSSGRDFGHNGFDCCGVPRFLQSAFSFANGSPETEIRRSSETLTSLTVVRIANPVTIVWLVWIQLDHLAQVEKPGQLVIQSWGQLVRIISKDVTDPTVPVRQHLPIVTDVIGPAPK